MKHIAFSAALIWALPACSDRQLPMEPVSAAPPRVSAAQARGRPAEVSGTFQDPGVCAFPLLIEFTGKAKTIELSGGRTIFTSPGLTTTITNRNTGKQETLSITGAFHQTVLENGDVVTVVTGRNLLFDPIAGLVLAIGRYSYAFDAAGNLIQPLQGIGPLIDICELLA
jgi:hypothetical protein